MLTDKLDGQHSVVKRCRYRKKHVDKSLSSLSHLTTCISHVTSHTCTHTYKHVHAHIHISTEEKSAS